MLLQLISNICQTSHSSFLPTFYLVRTILIQSLSEYLVIIHSVKLTTKMRAPLGQGV